MELLFGLEPLTALAIGVGALALAPVVTAVEATMGKSLSESSKDLAKNSLTWSFDALDKTQTFFHEVGESFQDLVAEAKAEQLANKVKAENKSSIS